jgi:uncharacterized protein
MSKDIVKTTQQYILKECKNNNNPFWMIAYNYHFKYVVRYSKQLAKKRNADIEIVLVSAWLHDIASIKENDKDHHIMGLKYADDFLREHNYPFKKRKQVKHCIYAHRGSRDIKRETIEAECLCDADAMSHFSTIGALFYLAYNKKNMEPKEATEFVKKKLQRSYNKLTPLGKKLIQEKYDSIMGIL